VAYVAEQIRTPIQMVTPPVSQVLRFPHIYPPFLDGIPDQVQSAPLNFLCPQLLNLVFAKFATSLLRRSVEFQQLRQGPYLIVIGHDHGTIRSSKERSELFGISPFQATC
jgi:hypothetical protein